MAAKRFKADVRSARNRVDDIGIDAGVVAVEHGKADGEVIFTFIHNKLNMPIDIHLVSVNPSGYPDDNNFLLNTSTNHSNPTVTAALQNLQNYTFGKTVFESVREVANGLTSALDSKRVNIDGDTPMDGAADNANVASDDEFNDAFDNDDDYPDGVDFGVDLSDIESLDYEGSKKARMQPGILNKIKRDLRKAREAGAKIGIFDGISEHASTHLVSLSIRARKLGISDEALEAWDVDPSDYIVLVLRLHEPYPSAKGLLDRPTSDFFADFRFGKCNRSKPSDDSVRRAFKDNIGAFVDDGMFSKLFISSSMEQFMKESFLPIFKARLLGVPTWDDANDQIHELTGLARAPDVSNNHFSYHKGQGKGNAKGKGKEIASYSFAEAHQQQTLPTILAWDSFAEESTDISMPLVALQFALHYFTRSTEYCVRCHRKVNKEFEALKPYVCENPLCLFQYIAMGLGPSVEHEIRTQPYVVDLLVTLCYSSVMGPSRNQYGTALESFPIRNFPTGLRLKVPSPASHAPKLPEESWNRHGWFGIGQKPKTTKEPPVEGSDACIEINLNMNDMSFNVQKKDDALRLPANSWVLLRSRSKDPDDNCLTQHGYISYFDALTNKGIMELKALAVSPASSAVTGSPDPTAMPSAHMTLLGLRGLHKVDLFVYNFDFDELDDAGKAASIRQVLDTLPPVSQIRQWLLSHPHSHLKDNPDISPSAFTLLEWIIASNRSFIVQVSPVKDTLVLDKEVLHGIKTRPQEVIPSMGEDYVQFRFAMGNPDKELRFHRALKELQAQTQTEYPTIFAWHGSPIQNWHSILRHGLDYTKMEHGRAYGNGVYLSNQQEVSMGYAHSFSHMDWPNSALRPSSVLALCEIINNPAKFLSKNPHYVVDQLDWIQCRYLFVHTSTVWDTPANRLALVPGASTSSSQPGNNGDDCEMVELKQDPHHVVCGPSNRRLRIPQKALPASRGAQDQFTETSRASPKRSRDVFGADTDEEDAADLDALFSDDESSPPPSKRFQSLPMPEMSRDSSVDTMTVRRLTTQRPLTPPKQPVLSKMTDFIPGSLDLTSIPKLAQPEWANPQSSRRLMSDIRMMRKIQETTPLHELGWYIDFDHFAKMDNMFQWIVELHSFDAELPLAKDMKRFGITSIVLELRFGRDYPYSPPFVRVIRPKFLPFMQGGGGHVTIGGAICMEMLTTTGWMVSMSLESVLVSIKAAMSDMEPQPARLMETVAKSSGDYSAYEALDAFQRFAGRHGWKVPQDVAANATQQYNS